MKSSPLPGRFFLSVSIAIIGVTCFITSAKSEEISLFDFDRYEDQSAISVTDAIFKASIVPSDAGKESPDIPKHLLSLTAVFPTEDDIKGRAWHGVILRLMEPIPSGTLEFKYKPVTQEELWVVVTGKDAEGNILRLDYPIQMYGANPAILDQWNVISLNLRKGHVNGSPSNTFGSLETIESIQFQLHPQVHIRAGSYEWLFGDFKIAL